MKKPLLCFTITGHGVFLGETSKRTESTVNPLISYLLDNLILDFEGELDLDMVRNYLKGDESKEARTLYARVVADGGVDDMLLVLADCLKESVRTGIDEETLHEQIRTYVES
jgi:hypothetical protein